MKKKLSTLMLFTACLLFSYSSASAQSWNIAGNSNATSSSKLGNTNSIPLRLFTNNSVRMYIHASNGNVAIGNGNAANSSYRLYVKGPTNGIYGQGASYGVYGDGGSYGLYGNSINGFGGIAISTNSDGFDAYTTSGYYGIYASCGSYTGIYGYGGTTGTYGYGGTYGINGYSSGGYGVYGNSYNGYGIYGQTTGGYSAGYFHSVNGYGIGAASDNAAYAAVFFGSVYSSVGFATSDRKLKKNIEEISDAMSIINKLQPKHYEFKTDAEYKVLHLPGGKHYGLIAQDLEEILPDLVHGETFQIPVNSEAMVLEPKTADGKDINQYREATPPKTVNIDVKAVNYTELIPVIIKAMQEQDKVIQQQNEMISEMKQKIDRLTSGPLVERPVHNYLIRCTPNPAHNSVNVYYNNLPQYADARLAIYDSNGRMVKQVELNNESSGSVVIDISSLSAGIYSYTLLMNGKSAESGTMEVAR